jgi:transposase-like protein
MTERLGYEKNSSIGDNSRNNRNGHSEKTVPLESQSTTIEVPQDMNGTFELIIVPKHKKRLPLFNGQIISMYSFGMTDRDIKSYLEKIYNVEVSPDLISRVTNAVLEDVSPPMAAGMAEPSVGKIIRDNISRCFTSQKP